jgi:hypothetical protein
MAALALPARMYRLTITPLAADGARSSRGVVCFSEGGEELFSFDEEVRFLDAGGERARDDDAALLLAVDDKHGRLFVGRRGSERVLVFGARTGEFQAAIDAPRLRALCPLLAGHVAVFADGGIHLYSPDWHKREEIAHELLDGCTRMAFDALKGRIVCLIDDTEAGGDGGGDDSRFSLVAVGVASEVKPAVLLPARCVPGRSMPWQRNDADAARRDADSAAAAARFAASHAKVAAKNAADANAAAAAAAAKASKRAKGRR